MNEQPTQPEWTMADNTDIRQQEIQRLLDLPKDEFDVEAGKLPKGRLEELKREATRRLEGLNKQIKIPQSVLNLVNKMSSGKLEDRFLAALKSSPESVYRLAYPRRYKDLKTHYSPKYALLIAATEYQAFRTQGLQTETNMDLFAESGHPTYWLSKELAESFLETDPSDVRLTINDFHWPHRSFLVMPPIECYSYSPVLILLSLHEDHASICALQPGFMGNRVEVDTQKAGYRPFHLLKVNGDLTIEATFASRDFKALPDDYKLVTKFALNCLLAMVAEPEFQREAKVSRGGSAGVSSPKRPSDSWNPHFLSIAPSEKSSDESFGSGGGAKRPHARRGHWRTSWKHDATRDLETTPLQVGDKALLVSDRRKVVKVLAIEGLSATVVDVHQQTTELDKFSLVPATAGVSWVRKAMVGLKRHLRTTP